MDIKGEDLAFPGCIFPFHIAVERLILMFAAIGGRPVPFLALLAAHGLNRFPATASQNGFISSLKLGSGRGGGFMEILWSFMFFDSDQARPRTSVPWVEHMPGEMISPP